MDSPDQTAVPPGRQHGEATQNVLNNLYDEDFWKPESQLTVIREFNEGLEEFGNALNAARNCWDSSPRGHTLERGKCDSRLYSNSPPISLSPTPMLQLSFPFSPTLPFPLRLSPQPFTISLSLSRTQTTPIPIPIPFSRSPPPPPSPLEKLHPSPSHCTRASSLSFPLCSGEELEASPMGYY
ncbi:hypothetical protein AN958_03643 [Leucoagaricus sp. SymC.cos]|nr:hypothetical protein AN958_03643 [Leucoagaricus sp. SymC.cos]